MTSNEQITPVEDLLTRARTYVEHSHAKNTLHAYAADWKHFTWWLVLRVHFVAANSFT